MAFRCFFTLLFGGDLPAGAVKYLSKEAKAKRLPAASGQGEKTPAAKKIQASNEIQTAEKIQATEKLPTPKTPKAPAPAQKKSSGNQHRDGSLALLALLQREGRLVDFLQEDIEDYEDSAIGAAVRDIHRGCRKVIRDHLTLEAVMPGEEEDEVKVPEGFDPNEVKLVGEVKGEPPFRGVLRHHGWRATDTRFPKLSADVDRHILAPAQVEVS